MATAGKRKDRDELRRDILEHAGKMLLAEGVHGISMRKLSKQLGTSTMVLYNCFENKQEILNELYLEGYARLKETLEAVPRGNDPAQYLMELGWAYRHAAQDNVPAYFLMQSRSLPGFEVPRDSLVKSRESFAVLENAVADCMKAGLVPDGDPREAAQILWATLHGLISLQLFGHFDDETEAKQRFQQAMTMMKKGLSVMPGQQEPT